jgi:hypothetical protein
MADEQSSSGGGGGGGGMAALLGAAAESSDPHGAPPSAAAGAPDPAPPPKKKISMLSKFKKAGNMIAMSNRMVKLRPTEVQYYNSAFAIFDLDFDKDKTKVEKSKPSWMATKMTKFGEALSSPTGGKNQAKASQSSSSDDSDDSSDEDFSL